MFSCWRKADGSGINHSLPFLISGVGGFPTRRPVFGWGITERQQHQKHLTP